MMKKIVSILLLLNFWCGLSQTVTIPDANFLAYLKSNFGSTIDGNDQLIVAQANAVTSSFNCSNRNIQSLEGLQYFVNITSLDASDNQLTECPQVSALSKIGKLDVKNNQITSLPSLENLKALRLLFIAKNQLSQIPSLDSNTKMEEIVAYDNLITTIPSLDKLIHLQKIDLGNNRLTQLPDLSNNLRLRYISVDRNYLNAISGLNVLDSIEELQIHRNYLSFSDFQPILNFPNVPSLLTLSPQRAFPHGDITLSSNDTLHLESGVDAALSDISYQWYLNNGSFLNSGKDTLYVYPASKQYQGRYHAEIRSSSFPGIVLYTDTFEVIINACPQASQLQFSFEKITCLKGGKMKISMLSMPVEDYTFVLHPLNSPAVFTSHTGVFENLYYPEYTLSINAGSQCLFSYPETIKVPFEICEESFFTPNGDGDKDMFYFQQQGTGRVLDKDGRIVTTLNLPGEWDGTISGGKKVTPGYYIVNINDGEEVVKISVLY